MIEKGHYGLAARLYDLLSGMLQHWGVKSKVVELCRAGRQTSVLDVCTGSGTFALAFAPHCDEVVGIDTSDWILRAARGRDKQDQVRYIKMDAAHMDFGDDDFDISLVAFALHDMTALARKQVLTEMKRVTRGRIVIVDYQPPANPLRRWLFLGLARLYDTPQMQDFVRGDFTAELADCGLKVVDKVVLRRGKVAAYVCEK